MLYRNYVSCSLGKSITDSLYKKLITSKVTDIYVALDTDARDKALTISEKLLNQGKKVFLVNLNDKDPSEMGFKAFTKLIQQAEELDLSGLMLHKMHRRCHLSRKLTHLLVK